MRETIPGAEPKPKVPTESGALLEIASRLKRLSFRDMKQLADVLGEQTHKNGLAEMLLSTADVLEGK